MNNLIISVMGFFLLPTPAIATTTPSITVIEPFPEVLEHIAICESNNVATAKNANSSAKGVLQFIDGSWQYYGNKLWGKSLKDKDVFNYNDSMELGVYVLSIASTTPWNASKKCWSK